MSDPKDPLPRLLLTYSLIPCHPGRIDVATLQTKLHERGFHISARTLQRNLKQLSACFPVFSEQDGTRHLWSRDRQSQSLPTQDTPGALALVLMEQYLSDLLPQGVLDYLSRPLRQARQHLAALEHNGLAHWPRQVRALPAGKGLLPAPLREGVWEQVSEALVQQRQLSTEYLSRSKGHCRPLVLNPLGVVSRHSVTYLVANVDGYEDIRHFALHRIRSCRLLETRPPEREFDLEQYIRSGAFGGGGASRSLQMLVADVTPQVAWLLRETPLSNHQQLTPLEGNDWLRLEAEVPDDQETLWWLYGLNHQVRVHAPTHWVDAIRGNAQAIQTLYEEPVPRPLP